MYVWASATEPHKFNDMHQNLWRWEKEWFGYFGRTFRRIRSKLHVGDAENAFGGYKISHFGIVLSVNAQIRHFYAEKKLTFTATSGLQALFSITINV